MFDKNVIISVEECKKNLVKRLAEKAPSRIQLLVGPRQIGKTTLLLDLEKRFGKRAFYVPLDSPESSLPGFWERFWANVEEAASAKQPAIALLDEVQVLPRWSSLLKAEWDRIARLDLPIHIVATGSSALAIGANSRESLAGRFEKMIVTHWAPKAFSKAFDLSPEEAVSLFVKMGAYPGAFQYIDDLARWKAYMRDAIIEPAIGRDILALTPIRKPALLKQIFAVCMAIPAQIVSLQKILGQLQDAGAMETVAHYLALLEEAFLVAALPKYSSKAIRMRASPPKIIALSNALIAAADPQDPPDAKKDPQRFGAWVENACLAAAWNSGQKVSYWREEPFEVDGVLEGSWGKWAVEVKTGSFHASDLKGLLVFAERHPEFRPLVVCDARHESIAEKLHVRSMTWQEFLLSGP